MSAQDLDIRKVYVFIEFYQNVLNIPQPSSAMSSLICKHSRTRKYSEYIKSSKETQL
jgi:hypothetical protein